MFKRTTLDLPEDLREYIEQEAQKQDRSISAQIRRMLTDQMEVSRNGADVLRGKKEDV